MYSFESKGIRIYPNPLILNHLLSIEARNELPLNFDLFTIQGRLVFSKQVVGNQYLDLSYLDQGMYIYKVVNQELKSSEKLMIIK
jgi:hypothetical protein